MQQIVDMPAQLFGVAAVTPDAGLDIAPGAAGIDIVAGGKTVAPQRAHPDGHATAKVNIKLVGLRLRH